MKEILLVMEAEIASKPDDKSLLCIYADALEDAGKDASLFRVAASVPTMYWYTGSELTVSPQLPPVTVEFEDENGVSSTRPFAAVLYVDLQEEVLERRDVDDHSKWVKSRFIRKNLVLRPGFYAEVFRNFGEVIIVEIAPVSERYRSLPGHDVCPSCNNCVSCYGPRSYGECESCGFAG